MLYDALKSTNQLEFPCWNYERYDVDEENNDESKAEFRPATTENG